MKSKMNVLSGVFLWAAALACAQDQVSKPQVPEDAFSTRQLIAWSSMQKPQPTPQPLPPPDKPIPQPDQPQDRSAGPEATASSEQSAAKAFVGMVVKDSAKYVLRVASGTTYQLANEGDAGQYENKNVKVLGELDGNTIHVTRIEVLS